MIDTYAEAGVVPKRFDSMAQHDLTVTQVTLMTYVILTTAAEEDVTAPTKKRSTYDVMGSDDGQRLELWGQNVES